MDDTTVRLIITSAIVVGGGVFLRKGAAALLRMCDALDERDAKRRGEWDPIAKKRIPYWDRPSGSRK